MVEKEAIAARIIAKYLRKGNMSRCLRDILPSTPLTKEQRETIADIVHQVVRWKKLYDFLIEEKDGEKTPEQYIQLAMQNAQNDVHKTTFDNQYSCSQYVADVLKKKHTWAEYLNESPPTTLCVNLNKSTTADVINILSQEKLPAEHSQLETAVLTTSIGRYSSIVQHRYAHVQDESSQLISLLAISIGEKICDYCAGNGGKSLSMASMTRNTKVLSAYEMNERKRIVLQQRCRDYDAQVTIEDHPPTTKFDVMLVDAPCTGIGAARRNPDTKYIEGPGEFPVLQLKILHEAAEHVTQDGVLLYSVCTFTPEETKTVVEQFVKTNGFVVSPLKNFKYAHLLEKHTYGAFTTVPNGDIFFLSVLKKEK